MKRYNTPHRSRVVKTRMTEEEYAEFAQRLSAYHMSQAEFIRQAITGAAIRPIITVSPVNDELLAAVGKLTAEYGRIGGNLNQIARTLNEWHSPYPQLAEEVHPMDRNQRSRNQKKSVPPRKGQPSHRNTKSAPPQRSSRPAGSQQRPKGSGQRPAKQPERQPPKQQQKRPRPQQNPQKPGYRSSAPQVQRRVTRAEQLRIRRRKAIIGVLCVLAVLVVGIVLSINLLFKVTDFRVENADRTTPANTGIYTEQQLIDATGIQVGDNLYGFSTKEKSDQLLAQMPYLDVAVVTRQAPGTVIIRVQPAVERFKMEYSGSWLVLSEQLKVLRVEPAEPDNLVQLDALLPEGAATTPGSFLTLDAPSEPTALATAMPSGTATPENADEADTAQETPNEVLNELLGELDQYGLLDGTTVLTMQNMTELSFLYQGRVSVQLGTANNLDYKIRFAAYIILDTGGDGLASSDRGTLDVSDQQTDGTIQPRFLPAENPVATPEPTPEPPAEDTTDAAADGADLTADAPQDDTQSQE